jgi:hypothetical protein
MSPTALFPLGTPSKIVHYTSHIPHDLALPVTLILSPFREGYKL